MLGPRMLTGEGEITFECIDVRDSFVVNGFAKSMKSRPRLLFDWAE